MHLKLVVAAVILVLFADTFADNCNLETIFELEGNQYCTSVQAIRYENVGTAGVYRQIVEMSSNGECSSVPKAFYGPLSPLDEEVSLHFRGPLHLKQLAVYKLNGVQKRDASIAPSRIHRNHARYNPCVEPEAFKEPVWDDLAGDVVEDRAPVAHNAFDDILDSFIDWWFKTGQDSKPKPKPTATAVQDTASVAAHPTADSSAFPQPSGMTGQFSRIGYYDFSTQHLDGMTFLGNYGGDGSGTFDLTYGSSLSYLSTDGTKGADSPRVLSDSMVGSATEYTIMTDDICNGDCGFVRPDGFDGTDKLFLVEFQMPFDGNKGFQGDTPAIWMLNAQIPRTSQYGDPNCSCWASGCGELDIVEVLSPGLVQCKSAIHTSTPAGDSDYITRPTNDSMKLAVILQSSSATAHIQVLDKTFSFSISLTGTQVEDIYASSYGSQLLYFMLQSEG